MDYYEIFSNKYIFLEFHWYKMNIFSGNFEATVFHHNPFSNLSSAFN